MTYGILVLGVGCLKRVEIRLRRIESPSFTGKVEKWQVSVRNTAFLYQIVTSGRHNADW